MWRRNGCEQASSRSAPVPAAHRVSREWFVASMQLQRNRGNVGRELKDLGIDRTLVCGYTDNVGPPQYNLALSCRSVLGQPENDNQLFS